MESAGIRTYRKRSGPGRRNNRPWSGSGGGRQATDPLPALGRARPLVLEMRCLDTYELLNSWIFANLSFKKPSCVIKGVAR